MTTRIIIYDSKDSINTYMLADIATLQSTRWKVNINEIFDEEYTDYIAKNLDYFFPLSQNFRYSFSDRIEWFRREPFLLLLVEQFPHLYI